jgi:hypothetical protein
MNYLDVILQFGTTENNLIHYLSSPRCPKRLFNDLTARNYTFKWLNILIFNVFLFFYIKEMTLIFFYKKNSIHMIKT